MNLSIPKTIKDVDSQWVLKLVQILEKVPELSKIKIAQLNIEQELNNEGVLSDSCKVYLQVKIEGVSPKKSLVYRWFVKTVPQRYQNVVIDNRLFEKEVFFYRQVFPLLQSFLKSKAVTLKHFKVPKFIFGDVNSQGEGVLVLEDLSSVGFDTFDPTLMLMDFERLTASIMALAEFHGLCMAFDRTFENKTLAQAFPIFETSHLMWMKDEMLHFLTRVSHAAAIFLKHFLNEEHWKKMALLLKHPKHIMDGEFARRKSSQWNCLQHGDSWHNNFLFRKIGLYSNILFTISKRAMQCLAVPVHDLRALKIKYVKIIVLCRQANESLRGGLAGSVSWTGSYRFMLLDLLLFNQIHAR